MVRKHPLPASRPIGPDLKPRGLRKVLHGITSAVIGVNMLMSPFVTYLLIECPGPLHAQTSHVSWLRLRDPVSKPHALSESRRAAGSKQDT